MARQDAAGDPAAAVRRALGPVVERIGLVLEDVTFVPAGGRRVLRVVVDGGAHGGLSLDAVAEASREISATLDGDDLIGAAPYVLEVSSPGLDRPLTERRHFRRSVRRRVEVVLADGSRVTGRVRSAEDSLVLDVPGAKTGTTSIRELTWDDVVRGHVQVDFTGLDESEE